MEIISSSLLAGLPGIEHAFGTRHSTIIQDDMASLRQVHSATVLIVEGTGCTGEGDALVSSDTGLAVSVRTADCLPILLADPERRVIAAVHAGWRGSAARIVLAAVERMCTMYGSKPVAIHAAIGPGIGECCYKVGSEVAAQFGLEGTVKLDLAAANREQLVAAGVPATQIDVISLCTRCRADLFHSWRRDGTAAGRMISYIRLTS